MNKNLLQKGGCCHSGGIVRQRLVRLRSRGDSTRAERSSISSDGLAHSGSNRGRLRGRIIRVSRVNATDPASARDFDFARGDDRGCSVGGGLKITT